jgi:hypothetical protein
MEKVRALPREKFYVPASLLETAGRHDGSGGVGARREHDRDVR